MALITMGELLKPGAPTLDKTALEVLLDLYLELLDEVGPERFIAAYQLVLKSSKFRPDISELRLAAGLLVVYPVEREAKDEFAKIISLMRHHGRRLTNRGKPEIEPPVLSGPVLATLRDLGYGDHRVGLEVIWAHPALDLVRKPEELADLESFRAVAGEKIEKRWVEAYTRIKAVLEVAI